MRGAHGSLARARAALMRHGFTSLPGAVLLARVPPTVFPSTPFADHALLDSGEGQKLERFGARVLWRPDPQALWPKRDPGSWKRADLRFELARSSGAQRGVWHARDDGAALELASASAWNVRFGAATFALRPTAFKHVGLFPEQASNWEYLARALGELGHGAAVLNLFGYTGAASVLALQAGAQVTHVDASKAALAWARENLRHSGLKEDAMRLVLDDALTFARKAARRKERFDLILADPPHHGRGPRGEEWQFERDVAGLVRELEALLAPRGALVFSTYAFGFSPLGLQSLLAHVGQVDAAELALEEAPLERAAIPASRLLACGACARVTRGLALQSSTG